MENKRYILDSNVYIAAYLEKDTLHEKALLIMAATSANEIYLPYCVIEEVCSVLTYKESKKKAIEFLEDLEKSENVTWLNNDYKAEVTMFKKTTARISFVDSSLLFLYDILDAELITFDKQLLRLYKKSKVR